MPLSAFERAKAQLVIGTHALMKTTWNSHGSVSSPLTAASLGVLQRKRS